MGVDEIIVELKRYESELEDILSRFTHNREGIHIGHGDDPRLRQYVHELVDLFNDVGQKSYSSQFTIAFNDGISNFIGSPTHHSVQSLLAILRPH